ncbi:hypothetical protein CDD83_10153 [Cordyceps sp. RAO-2017]|nr:hypothetical protein CDD83_10153 [Cordyceps sp. RAO-2017]
MDFCGRNLMRRGPVEARRRRWQAEEQPALWREWQKEDQEDENEDGEQQTQGLSYIPHIPLCQWEVLCFPKSGGIKSDMSWLRLLPCSNTGAPMVPSASTYIPAPGSRLLALPTAEPIATASGQKAASDAAIQTALDQIATLGHEDATAPSTLQSCLKTSVTTRQEKTTKRVSFVDGPDLAVCLETGQAVEPVSAAVERCRRREQEERYRSLWGRELTERKKSRNLNETVATFLPLARRVASDSRRALTRAGPTPDPRASVSGLSDRDRFLRVLTSQLRRAANLPPDSD